MRYKYAIDGPTFDASNLWIAGVTLGTEADRLVVVDIALGIGATVAGVHTLGVEAGQGLQTVVIHPTANNCLR